MNDQALKCYQYLYSINNNNIDYVNRIGNLQAKSIQKDSLNMQDISVKIHE